MDRTLIVKDATNNGSNHAPTGGTTTHQPLKQAEPIGRRDLGNCRWYRWPDEHFTNRRENHGDDKPPIVVGVHQQEKADRK